MIDDPYMQEAVTEEYLPSDSEAPDTIHTLPEQHYPKRINVVDELVDRHVREGRGDNVAIYFEDREITYSELQEQVNRLGNALKDLGVEPGDRVVARFRVQHSLVDRVASGDWNGTVRLTFEDNSTAKSLHERFRCG